MVQVDQPQAEGTFPVQIQIFIYPGAHNDAPDLSNSHLSVIQKNFYKFDRPGGREAARLFSLKLKLF